MILPLPKIFQEIFKVYCRPAVSSGVSVAANDHKKALTRWFRPPYSLPAVSLATAAFIVIFDNQLFWHNLTARLGASSFDHWRLALTLGAILVLLFHLVFSLVSFKAAFKPFLGSVLLIAAGVSYFSDAFGVVIDKSMIHNLLETDVREAGELMTWSLLWHLLLYGVVPAILVLVAPIRYPSWQRGWLLRVGGIVVSLALALALFMTDFKGFVLFGRENRDLQVFMNPSYPVYALTKVVKMKYFAPAAEPLQRLGTDAVCETKAHRSVVVLVLGETARSANWSLNGYERNTNPYTSSRDIVNFTHVESCGTATAESVPCMFSGQGKDRFKRSKAENSENVLDILQRAGVKVIWRDNDAGSKGVANRVVYENFAKRSDPRFCANGSCYDEVLLGGLEELIRNSKEDLLVVLHIMGSHGPSYYKRSPAALKAFFPECTQDNVQDCSQLTIINAYDNTIVYTDYLLGKVIDLLQVQDADTAMLYLSDHGESLGENGIYLHGLPYFLAPEEQTHIPMLFWGSKEFLANHCLDRTALLAKQNLPYSHDNLFHSLLGVFHVKTKIYREDLDMFVNAGHPLS